MIFINRERELKDDYPILVGLNEADGCPLAGPVYATCVCLPTGIFINGLINDSKKMSEEKRSLIAAEIAEIKEQTLFYTYGHSSVEEIDNLMDNHFFIEKYF